MTENQETMQALRRLDLHESLQIDGGTWAMRVPGGWIYHSVYRTDLDGYPVAGSQVFVPDLQKQ